MPLIEISIAGRRHQVQCGDGEEPRVRKLAAYIDSKATEIARGTPKAGGSELLMLTGLFITDELFDLYAELQRWRSGGEGGPPDGLSEEAASVIDRVAARLEQLAVALENT
ncbi:cell division protein ZapA [Arboricoccus pini]|uniref:Cell division protein ZapA n=1 Tax=Arboricoccus pini TaxID=1963835 RepID=A0A212PXB6_9PROT|nr:cell division protein ZapA [Arboricoccus pini]SNB51641.1 cell division protein ZapA [Arboricoccus pini]